MPRCLEIPDVVVPNVPTSWLTVDFQMLLYWMESDISYQRKSFDGPNV